MSETAMVPAGEALPPVQMFGPVAGGSESVSLLGMTRSEVKETLDLCKLFADTGYFLQAVKQGAPMERCTYTQLFVKILYGRALGLDAMQSLTNVYLVEGKPSIGAAMMAAAIKASTKYDYRVVESTAEVCIIEFFNVANPREEKKIGEASFTIGEASRANLTGKFNWKAYPGDMLFARALSRGYRRHCPDAFGSTLVYTSEEMGDGGDEALPAVTEEKVAPRRRRSTSALPEGSEVTESAEVTEVPPSVPQTAPEPQQDAPAPEPTPEPAKPAETPAPAPAPEPTPEKPVEDVKAKAEAQLRRQAALALKRAYADVTGQTADGELNLPKFVRYVQRTLKTEKRADELTTDEMKEARAEILAIPTVREQINGLWTELWADLREWSEEQLNSILPVNEAEVVSHEWAAILGLLLSQEGDGGQTEAPAPAAGGSLFASDEPESDAFAGQ